MQATRRLRGSNASGHRWKNYSFLSAIITMVDETGIADLEGGYTNQFLHKQKQRARGVPTKDCK